MRESDKSECEGKLRLQEVLKFLDIEMVLASIKNVGMGLLQERFKVEVKEQKIGAPTLPAITHCAG